EYDGSAVTPGSIPNFPFRDCNTTNGAYRLAPVWRPSGSNTYCFKIQVSQDALSCTGACCSADLHKIEVRPRPADGVGDATCRHSATGSTCYNANDALAKIEWYLACVSMTAGDAFRSAVKGFTVYPAGGSNKTIADSWGATGTDTLKVNLNWNLLQANGGKVCVAIQNPFTMGDICKGALGYASIFNRDNSDYCCPIYRTGP
ncbi:extracellular matrix glycoprotein pherophorin-V13, partial [Volvox carteri f. nagariensis]